MIYFKGFLYEILDANTLEDVTEKYFPYVRMLVNNGCSLLAGDKVQAIESGKIAKIVRLSVNPQLMAIKMQVAEVGRS